MSINLSKGLVGHWPLSQKYYNPVTKRVTDLSPYSNHGTTANAASFVADRMGQIRAMSFNGTSDYVDCGNDSSLNIIGDMSISIYIKLDPATGMLLTKSAADQTSTQFEISMLNDTVRFRASNGTTTFAATYGGLVVDTWYHIVGVFVLSTGVLSIYVNIIKGTDATLTGVKSTAIENVAIGCRKPSAPQDYGEFIADDVRIYNRVLSTEEITYLYESYNPKLAIDSLSKGLVLDTPLNTIYQKTGDEVLTNGDFSDNTYTDSSVHALVGWDNIGTHNATNKTIIAGGQANIISDGTYTAIKQTIVAGKKYIAMVNVTNITSGTIRFQNNGLTHNLSAGINKWEFIAGDVNFSMSRSSACDVTFDDVSVKEVLLTDKTPHSNNGSNYGATVGAKWTSFNGTTDYVRIPDSVSLSPTSAMSAFVWVKGTGQSNNLISHYDYDIDQRAYRLMGNGNKIQAVISNDGSFGVGHRKQYYSSIIALDTTPHQVGFTFDAGTLKLYVDGIEDTNPTKIYDDAIITIHPSTADVMVGCDLKNNVVESFLAGDMAKPRIWNHAITPTEALLWFDQTRGLFL